MMSATSGDTNVAPDGGEKDVRQCSDDPAVKKDAILQACLKKDLLQLVRFADAPGGFIDDEIRRCAWPVLLGSDSPSSKPPMDLDDGTWKTLPPHRDEEQVQLDVNRAFVYYPSDETEKEIGSRKSQLSNLIVRVLRQHPMLCYFQGYHDIVQVLLLVLGETQAPSAVARISLLRIRDFMLPSLKPSLDHLKLIPAILYSADPLLADRLSDVQPFFALAATLTLYAHEIEEYSDIARIYDFILAHEPVMSIYMFAAIVISRRSELLDIPADEPDMLHFTLTKLPQPLDLDALVSGTLDLFLRHPPQSLPYSTWRKIPKYSVLKKSRSLETPQSLNEGETLFHKQAMQLRREELREKALKLLWRYRGPATSVAAALFIGAVSIWLRRGGDRIFWRLIGKA